MVSFANNSEINGSVFIWFGLKKQTLFVWFIDGLIIVCCYSYHKQCHSPKPVKTELVIITLVIMPN